MIPFTRRELVNAWNTATAASKATKRNNAHRLLLFYAVECGLKAVYLKRHNKDPLDSQTAAPLAHDLNRILDLLNVAQVLRITPKQFTLPPLQKPLTQRNCRVGELNQVWRYGGMLAQPTDIEVEEKLEAVQVWIAKELQ